MKTGVFKTEEARDKFRACYSRILGAFPFAQQYVETAQGRTFMLAAGDASNPPVILLHGSCGQRRIGSFDIQRLICERAWLCRCIGGQPKAPASQ